MLPYSSLRILAVRFIPPLTGSREKSVYTDTGLLSMKQLGPHLIILPGGPVVDSFPMELSNDFLVTHY